MLVVGCLTSQQHASVSQGRICSDNLTCCHNEIKVADQTFYLTQSQYTDTGPTSPSADPITPGAWQGSHWSANFQVTGMTRPWKNLTASGIRTRDLPLSRRMPYPLGQRGGHRRGPSRWCRGHGPASRTADRDSIPRFGRGSFPGSSHTGDLNIDVPVATLPGAWGYRASSGSGRPGVSIL